MKEGKVDNISVISKKDENILEKYYLGDINLDLDKAQENLPDMTNLLTSFGLQYYINEPTRITNRSSSCLDNIITNISSTLVSAGVIKSDMSDHYPVFVTIDYYLNKPVNDADVQIVRAINDKRICKFVQKLRDTNWDFIHTRTSSEEITDTLIKTLSNSVNCCFPLIKKPVRHNQVAWFTDRLKEIRSEVSEKRLRYNTTKSDSDWCDYSSRRADYRRAIKEEKKANYSAKIMTANNRTKMSWNIINSEVKIKSKNHSSTSLTSDELNLHFSTICDRISKSIDTQVTDDPEQLLKKAPKPISSFFMTFITESDVRAAICNLSNSPSLDHYGLNSAMIKDSIDILLYPLTTLYNKCMEEGNWPDSLKISKIIPVYKKGDKDCSDNFRPITMIPLISKIFEIIIKERIVSYLSKFNILTPFQFGFRKNKSTIHAVLTIIAEVVEGLDEGQHTNAVMCDLSKAFDCVNTQILIMKLEYYGFRGNVKTLLTSYLTNRKQYVVMNGKESKIAQVLNGVPQGSVLGPVLFLLYINDLPSSFINDKCVIFADDTTILTRAGRQSEMDKAKIWFSSNKLKLNDNKSTHILFSSDKHHPRSQPVKLLGIMLDTSLSWSCHIDCLCAKLSSQLFAMRQLKTYLLYDALRLAYFSLVDSHLNYGILLWGGSTAVGRVFTLQKKAVRILEGAPPGTSCRTLFKKHNILTLPSIYIINTLKEIHKNLSNHLRHSDFHQYKTRTAMDLVVPYSRIRITEINKIDIRIYNKFAALTSPLDISKLKERQFYTYAKRFLLDYSPYSVDEFLSI
nr:unnamed protein product [Callosobruchus analis]